ncbi:collagen-like protein [Sphingobacterium psychroaquaticum]|uniref:collagen-like protein n=1 Tax=Sphingobacterium psychroaquaticum TaxID=561061 RepID=UPI001069369A|nr:collagen-like protein [Sphingobacterium psychroaquaticum]QBQ41746.1 collagen-like protein [Sphingobacterium psychroaquaticum]
MKHKYSIFIGFLLAQGSVMAQSKVSDDSGTNALPSKNAILELNSTKRGLLHARVELKATANPYPLTAHEAGIMVFNTKAVGDVQVGIYYNDGQKWVANSSAYDLWLQTGNKGTVSDFIASLKGSVGPAGTPGIAGAKGEKGDPGLQGITGAKGEKGDAGLQGAVGPQGVAGAKGEKGDTGLQGAVGPQGITGAKGEKGDTGLQGAVGPQGITGAKGEKGDTGLQGAVGPQGITGAKGEKGDTGLQGAVGPQGITGAKGEKGDTGLQGAVGPQGITGAKGEKGDTGLQGVVGPQGPAGPAGSDASINGVTAGGDLTGAYPDPKVVKLQGVPMSSATPATNNILRFDGTQWVPSPASSGGFTLPYTADENSGDKLFSLRNAGDGTAVSGTITSTSSSVSAVQGRIESTSAGGFSTGVRGMNDGTGGLGIGVWGSHAGSGWGLYGVTPNGLGVYGNATANGTGVYANSTSGVGLTATSNNGRAANISIFNNSNNSNVLDASTVGNGTVINVQTTGTGGGVLANTNGGISIKGITTAQTSAGILGQNSGGGEAVVGLTTSDIAGAVVGRNDGGGYGVRGFISTNSSGKAIGVFGQVGLNNSTGRAGRFENYNTQNIDANTLEVVTNGNGNIPDNSKGNAASFIVDNTNSVAAAVRAEVNTIFGNFGAAAVFGKSSGTGGYAGLFHAANVNGNGTALVVKADGNGNAITTNAAKNGNAIEASTQGTGTAVYGWVPSFGLGKAAKFANFNESNTQATVDIESEGKGATLLVNHTGSEGNLVVFQSGGANVARINKSGRAFFNGGTQNSGADIAEAFDVIGGLSTYEAGDVLVISKDEDRTVEKSASPYSTLVVGVYATKPGVLLTEESMDTDISDKVPMGVVGVIPTKVCLEGGAIERGDLLVTSSIPGVAMKADVDKVKVGQVIGKALQPYKGSKVEKIKVLVNVK